jgi:cytochrome c553
VKRVTARRGAAGFLAAFAWMLVAGPAPAAGPDLEAIRKKAETCLACHGPDGNSTQPAIPTLAGQPKQFITTQLVMYREGRRINPLMAPFTTSMSNADINEYGTFFSAQARVSAGRTISSEAAEAGRKLTERLNCTQCHGPGLKGQQHIPGLAGQQPDYLRVQLQGFKAQTRFDMDGNMTSAAQPLSTSDIDLLADYLASLH